MYQTKNLWLIKKETLAKRVAKEISKVLIAMVFLTAIGIIAGTTFPY